LPQLVPEGTGAFLTAGFVPGRATGR